MTQLLIAGASGLVGRSCLQGALATAEITQVHALGRRRLGLTHPKLHDHVVAFEQLEQVVDVPQLELALCCLGSTIRAAGSRQAFWQVDVDFVVAFAELAKRLGCQHFALVSSKSASLTSPFFYSRAKAAAEAKVCSLGFASTAIYRPSLLLGERLGSKRPLEHLAQKASGLLSHALQGPLAAYRPIAAQDVAAAMLRGAQRRPPGVHLVESDAIAAAWLGRD